MSFRVILISMKFFIILILLASGLCAQQFSVVFKTPWSAQGEGLASQALPEGLYGPQAFSVAGDLIYVLDNQNGKLKVFKKNHLLEQYAVPVGCFNFTNQNKAIYAYDAQQIWKIGLSGYESVFMSSGRELVSNVGVEDGELLSIRLNHGQRLFFDASQKRRLNKTNSALLPQIAVYKEQSGRARIDWRDGHAGGSFDVVFSDNNLGSIQQVGPADLSSIYLNIELITEAVPLRVKREVRRYDRQGHLLNTIHLPARAFAFIQNDLYVDQGGILYHMFADEEGVQIIRWDPANLPAGELTCPQSWFRFEKVQAQGPAQATGQGREQSALFKTTDFPQVTPEEALAIGDSYVQLNWECGAENITNGRITDSYGYQVQTPDWVLPGSLQKIPYKWGGFQTLQQFTDGIAAGKYAGDRYTSKSSGTPSAVGVDCSGFVSRCWKLPSHYSTRMMDDAITIAYDNWDQTRPGDAVHKVGHVRMVVGHNADGTITVVESAGYNWRVSYRAYSYAELYNYTPRYYVNMQGTPGNIPQPNLLAVLQDQNIRLNWQMNSGDAVAGLRLAESADGKDWPTVHSLSKDMRSYDLNGDLQSCRFFKLSSFAGSSDSAESLPSDVYGCFRSQSAGKVLIVDGFDRTAATSGSWSHVYHQFAVPYGRALFNLGLSFETAANEAVTAGSVDLNSYAAVIWILGDESTADETFDINEQNYVQGYLQNGGNLFVSGSEVAWDLDYKGNSRDKDFFRNYLKAQYIEDDAGSYTVNGISSTPFDGITLHFDNGSKGVYEEDYPDVIKPLSGAEVALRYANNKTAAIYFEGQVPGGNSSAKLFYMGFPFETIFDETEQQALMSAVMSFFDLGATAITARPGAPVDQFRLLGNYPNPFNGGTSIHYYAPRSGKVELRIFNSLGQRVWEDSWIAVSGIGQRKIELHNLNSGQYFYYLALENGRKQYGRLAFVK